MGLVNAVYVSNVLNGTVAAGGATVNGGTVVRLILLSLPGLPPRVIMSNVIAEGFPERTSESAFVEGPTGLAVTGHSMFNQTLYAVDTVQNRIAEVPNALLRFSPAMGGGTTVAQGGEINDPLGMATAPQGHNLLVASAGNERILELNPSEGTQLASFNTGIGPGGLFGLTLNAKQNGISFVNDNENSLDLLH
jgi:DNA-binding beta-propeller fold protein YncE